jgi:hypothetical protein
MAIEGPGGPARFEVIRSLGEGGEGRVDLVFDRQREQAVAMKRVASRDAASMRRLKHEFRSIEQLLHPCLVRVYELGQDAEGLFFTMEAIEGTTLDAFYRGEGDSPSAHGGPVLRLDRLAKALPGILDGLSALHGRGLVHRDLKPSNVLVATDGSVKLLDFGILAELGASGELVGSVGYMAPEQIEGNPVSPATDLYALGAILFRLVTGHPVFSGPVETVLVQHATVTAPALAERCPDAPEELVEACRGLLARDPSLRPTIADLRASLLPRLGAMSARAVPSAPRAGTLLGRAGLQDELLALLRAAREGAFAGLILRGATGVGKTALSSYLRTEASAAGMVSLVGRGRPTERVPFNVIDGVVDGLAALLESDEDAIELAVGDEVGVVATAFPVLRESAGPPRSTRRGSRRADVFASLSAVLARIASLRGGLLLVLDDIHWADDDSVAAMADLVERAPSGVLLVGTERDDVGPSSASAWLDREHRVRRRQVPPLGEREIGEIIARAAGDRGFDPESGQLRLLARRSAGRPFLAEVLGRALAARSDLDAEPSGALASLVDAADASSRAILAALLVAEQAATTTELGGALAKSPGKIDDAVSSLERDGLVRRVPSSSGALAVDLYHDVVRAVLAERLATADLLSAHEAWLGVRSSLASERVVRHLLGATREKEAASLALETAPFLAARFAFGLAAELYTVALDHGAGDPRDVLRALAVALERGARFREAASRWSELSRIASTPEEREDGALNEAAALLGGTAVKEGHDRLVSALSQAGLPSPRGTGVGALWAGVRFLVGPITAPPPVTTSKGGNRRARAERDVRIGTLLTYFNPLAGVQFLLRARAGFVSAGAAEQAAYCDYVFAYLALFSDPTRRTVALSRRYVASARARLGDRPPESPEVLAFAAAIDGFSALRLGELGRAEPLLDHALATLEAAGLTGSFVHLYPLFNRCQIDMARQDIVAIERALVRMKETSRDSGETSLRVQLTMMESYVDAFRGRFDQALERILQLRRDWPASPLTVQRYLIDVMALAFERPVGDPIELRRRQSEVLVEWPFQLLRSADAGLYAASAGLIEARAMKAGDRQASYRAVVRYANLARNAPPFGGTGAIRALAYAEEVRGRPERALSLLTEAESEAIRWGNRMDIAIARYQRGKRLAGDEGTRLVSEGRELMSRFGAGPQLLDEDVV